jgi:hypothetical protein
VSALRRTLGLVAACVAVAWVLLVAAADGFRRSFGASEHGAWMAVLPVAVAALVVAPLIWPERRPLLHAAAVVVAALLGASLWVARQTVLVAALGVLYAAAWLLFYVRVTRAQ